MFRIGQVVGELVERLKVISQQHRVGICEIMADHLHLLVRFEVIHDSGGTLQRIHIIFCGIRMHVHRFWRIDVLVSGCRLRWRIILLLANQLDAERAVAAVGGCANGRMCDGRNLRSGN